MTFQLFPDQSDLMNDLRGAMKRHKAVLLQAATGSGKTAMATDMIEKAAAKNKRCIFGVPRIILMEQTSATFKEHGIAHSFIADKKPYDPFASLFIGMTKTMDSRRKKGALPTNINLFVPDETHVGDEALGNVIAHYQGEGAYTVGLSATPWKMNGQGLGVFGYKEMVCGKSIRWLIDNKRLSDYRLFGGRKRGDYDKLRDKSDAEIASIMEERREIIGDCVKEYIERGMGKLWIVRCTSIKHSQLTAQAFQDAGIPTAHVDGTTPADILDSIIKSYARREILVLCFADLLNFGFDLEQASGIKVCIEGCSDLKPSKSLAGQLQFWGRVLRYKLFPAIINDHVNNYLIHGLPCSERDWTLDSKKKKERGEKTPPSRQCPMCYAAHPPAPVCPSCKHVYEVEGRFVREVDGQLVEIDKAAIAVQKKEARIEQGRTETLADLIKLGRSKGYKNPVTWANKVMAGREAKKAKEENERRRNLLVRRYGDNWLQKKWRTYTARASQNGTVGNDTTGSEREISF